jgi:hypothetical protein
MVRELVQSKVRNLNGGSDIFKEYDGEMDR